MNILFEIQCDLNELKIFAKVLAKNSNQGDIFLLEGDLGVGKTTFSRFLIDSIFNKFNLKNPDFIKSPTFPIMLSYPLQNYEINHYDLYRVNNLFDLSEIGFFEEVKKNISIIEWPEIIKDNQSLENYYLIQFKFIDSKTRRLIIKHSSKLKYND